MSRLIVIVLYCLAHSAFAQSLPREQRTPGGVALISLPGMTAPVAEFMGQRVAIVQNKEDWTAIVGLPLALKPGKHSLQIVDRGVTHLVQFDVQDKAYPTQRLTVPNQRQVTPNPDDMIRIQSEQVRTRAALTRFTTELPANFALSTPVEGRQSPSFGSRRIFNGEPRNPHAGMDIAASTGTPIKSPAPGVVVETGDFFFNGNTVFVDHGHGLVTLYCHLSSIAVQPGDRVKPGDLLGQVGATGRVTGPHLHWGVGLNGVMVDPSLLLAPSQPTPKPVGK